MDTILKVIDKVTMDKQVKSIINSINDNQEKSKNWLVEKSIEYFTFFDKPKICIAAKEFYLFNEEEELVNYKKFLNEEALNDNFFKNLIQGLKKYLQEYELNGKVDDASSIIGPFLGS